MSSDPSARTSNGGGWPPRHVVTVVPSSEIVEADDADRAEAVSHQLALEEEAVEEVQHLGEGPCVVLPGEAPQRDPGHAHDRGGLRSLATDVADREVPDVAVAEDVVEVAAHLVAEP